MNMIFCALVEIIWVISHTRVQLLSIKTDHWKSSLTEQHQDEADI